jgi:hypothetical protein
METVRTADAPCCTLATYVVESGQPGAQKANGT